MNKEQKALIKLAQSAIGTYSPEKEDFAGVKWSVVYQLVVDSKIVGIVYDAVAGLGGEDAPPSELMGWWKELVMRRTIRQMSYRRQAGKMLELFDRAGIDYVVFKGPMLSDLYKKPAMRSSKDVDMLISEEHIDAAEAVFLENGFLYDEGESNPCVRAWGIPGDLQVELHLRLWEDYKGEQVERLERMKLTAPETLIRATTSIGTLTTMNHTEHLVFLIFHMIKHMMYKGLDLRGFLDITLFINRYVEEMDVERFWRCMDELKYTRFCEECLLVCREYFGMDSRILPPHLEGEGFDVDGFMTRLLDFAFRSSADGLYDVVADAVFRSCLKDQASGETQKSGKSGGQFETMRAMMFPGSKMLPERYAYAREHPVLLPVAWVHRAVRKIYPNKDSENGIFEVQRGLTIANERTGLLKEYNLID